MESVLDHAYSCAHYTFTAGTFGHPRASAVPTRSIVAVMWGLQPKFGSSRTKKFFDVATLACADEHVALLQT